MPAREPGSQTQCKMQVSEHLAPLAPSFQTLSLGILPEGS